MRNQPSQTPGQWRAEQVWIGGGNSPLTAVFVPPSHTRVPTAIDDLLAFARRDNVPLLAQIAACHAQFETIDPFADGNGRTGRALVQAMLRNKGLTRQVTVPVSAGLLADADGYIVHLPHTGRETSRPLSSGSRSNLAGDRQRPATGRRTARDPPKLQRQTHRTIGLGGVQGC
jgi:Fic family protein